MEIGRITDEIRAALYTMEGLRGKRVKVTIDTADREMPLSITLIVPTGKKQEERPALIKDVLENVKEELLSSEAKKLPEEAMQGSATQIGQRGPQGMLMEAMNVLLDQMQLTQEKMEEFDLQTRDVEALNRSIIEMARVMTFLSDAHLRREGGERCV